MRWLAGVAWSRGLLHCAVCSLLELGACFAMQVFEKMATLFPQGPDGGVQMPPSQT